MQGALVQSVVGELKSHMPRGVAQKKKKKKKELHVKVYSSFSHNRQKLERTQMSISWWTDKQIVVYLYNRILLSNEEQTWINLKSITWSERYGMHTIL